MHLDSKFFWQKKGCLYNPEEYNNDPKLLTHAANPLAVHLEKDIYRIFFSGRDYKNRSSVGAVDIDIVSQEIIYKHKKPFFTFGEDNSFYHAGVSIGCTYSTNAKRYMLFMGWQTPHNKHWRGDIGRLIITENAELELENESPLISSDSIDPISLSYPWIEKDSSGLYHMWYGSTLSWQSTNNEMIHVFNHATSQDGDIWLKTGQAVPHIEGVAQAFSRPTVLPGENNTYEMWFSYRSGLGETYRIGYAKSITPEKWELDLPATGITISESGWDSEMIEYPFVFQHNNISYMLYNGNGFGKSGFGLAIRQTKE